MAAITSNAGRALQTLARAGSALICGAAADIVHEIIFQTLLTTSAVAGVALALANLAVRRARGGARRQRAACPGDAAQRRASASVGACSPMA